MWYAIFFFFFFSSHDVGIPMPTQFLITINDYDPELLNKDNSQIHEAELLTETMLVEKGLANVELNGSIVIKSVATLMAYILSHLAHDWKAKVYVNPRLPTQIWVDTSSVVSIAKTLKMKSIRNAKIAELNALKLKSMTSEVAS
jgi:hypothetical protein